MDIITKEFTFFQNEHKLPLNHLSLTITVLKKLKNVDPNKDLGSIRDSLEANYETKQTRIPALDPHWIQKSRSYHLFQPYNAQCSAEENACFLVENWLFLQDICFLLSCSYQQFWCYILYEERVNIILDSFVLNAVSWYELKHLNSECKQLYSEIYDKVAAVYCRMLNDKESDAEYMTEAYKTNLILQNKIITFPHVTQLILLYEKTNQRLVRELLMIFDKSKDKFQTEIEKMFEHVKSVLDVINNQFLMHRSDLPYCTSYINPRPAIFDPNWFDELVFYILDTAATVNSFVRNSRTGLKAAINEQLPMQVARFYNATFPLIFQAFEDQGDLPEKWLAIKERTFANIAMVRMEFINLFHQFVEYYLNRSGEESLENYLSLITNILEEDLFLFDYHNSFRIDAQFENISKNNPNVDITRLNYVKQCLCNLPKLAELLEKHMFNYCEESSSVRNVQTDLSVVEGVREKTVQNAIGDEEIEKRILEIMDTLPDLGDAYILECLEHYNFSTTDVISGILDDTIPHHLITNPPNAIRVPPELPEPQQLPILAYKGKKPTYRDAKDMLNDKTDVVSAKVRNFILQASTAAYDPYDDEYDDRDEDDSANIAAYNKRMRERIQEKESDPYKYMENRFGDVDIVSDPSSSDDDTAQSEMVQTSSRGGKRGGYSGRGRDESSGTATGGRHNRGSYRKPDFCENPELMRERWEGSRRGGASRDVTGRPRGEGQEEKVQQNRDKKNTNKSSRANHSRKSGAAYKRTKGMLP